MQVGYEGIGDYFAQPFATVSGAPAHFAFHLDEMGHQAWADAQKNVCLMRADVSDSILSYPESRTGERITMIAWIWIVWLLRRKLSTMRF
jgi:hypothetical protein